MAFADKGSLTAAADALGITQPAASQAIHALETALGTTIITRADMTTTAEGETALVRFRRISDFVRQAPAAPRLASKLDTLLAWPHLRAVAAFLAHGSFSAAARGLGQSEPAVQRAAREAETIMGVPLFEGGGRTIRLTTAGQNAARAFNLAMSEYESARTELMERRDRFEGRLAIGTLPLTRTFLVPDAVAALAARYPTAQFEVLEGSYDALISELERGRIDILVGALRQNFASHTLLQERLFDYELKVVGRAGHPLSRQPRITADDLSSYPWIIARQGTPSRETFDAMAQTFPPGRAALRSVENRLAQHHPWRAAEIGPSRPALGAPGALRSGSRLPCHAVLRPATVAPARRHHAAPPLAADTDPVGVSGGTEGRFGGIADLTRSPNASGDGLGTARDRSNAFERFDVSDMIQKETHTLSPAEGAGFLTGSPETVHDRHAKKRTPN